MGNFCISVPRLPDRRDKCSLCQGATSRAVQEASAYGKAGVVLTVFGLGVF